MWPKCDAVDKLSVDCKHFGKRTNVFWAENHVGKFIYLFRQPRALADMIYVISHVSLAYNSQFLLRTFVELRWTPQFIMDSTKNLTMIFEHLHILDSLNFLPMSRKSGPK